MTLLSSVGAYEETPISRYLAAQADLSAVEQFSQRHDAGALPALEPLYRELLPATAPGAGQQYAFEVDLDACTGCKACVSACHSLNGLDEGEAWRSVTTLRGRPDTPLVQTVTQGCHHCVDPACLAGCPVDAYEKDPVTGIVKHLDDQCIGCSYCTLTCPYEVPRFNDRLGIVRKCDMCSDRLAEREAPACVQGCPNEAISITIVGVAAAIVAAEESRLVPGAPPSHITKPTTVYRRRPSGTEGRGIDTELAPPVRDMGASHAHTPLAVMLVLTQVAVGTFGLAVVRDFDPLVGLVTAAVAFAASVFHLGRPQYAWRAFIGLRHSWLSREVVTFGAFMGLGGLYALTSMRSVGLAAFAAGLAGVISSVMVYVVTRRASWRMSVTGTTFANTCVIGGLAFGNVIEQSATLAAMLAGATACTLAVRAATLVVQHRTAALDELRRRRLHLVQGDLRHQALRQLRGAVVAIFAAAVMAVASPPGVVGVGLALLAAIAIVVMELAHRSLFFTTMSPAR